MEVLNENTKPTQSRGNTALQAEARYYTIVNVNKAKTVGCCPYADQNAGTSQNPGI